MASESPIPTAPSRHGGSSALDGARGIVRAREGDADGALERSPSGQRLVPAKPRDDSAGLSRPREEPVRRMARSPSGRRLLAEELADDAPNAEQRRISRPRSVGWDEFSKVLRAFDFSQDESATCAHALLAPPLASRRQPGLTRERQDRERVLERPRPRPQTADVEMGVEPTGRRSSLTRARADREHTFTRSGHLASSGGGSAGSPSPTRAERVAEGFARKLLRGRMDLEQDFSGLVRAFDLAQNNVCMDVDAEGALAGEDTAPDVEAALGRAGAGARGSIATHDVATSLDELESGGARRAPPAAQQQHAHTRGYAPCAPSDAAVASDDGADSMRCHSHIARGREPHQDWLAREQPARGDAGRSEPRHGRERRDEGAGERPGAQVAAAVGQERPSDGTMNTADMWRARHLSGDTPDKEFLFDLMRLRGTEGA